MSEPDKPKRKFWQFHLSTAIFVMFVAAAILYEAMQFRRHPKALEFDAGWPFEACRSFPEPPDELHQTMYFRNVYDWTFVTIDFLLNGCLLLLVIIFYEWLLRRRENLKPKFWQALIVSVLVPMMIWANVCPRIENSLFPGIEIRYGVPFTFYLDCTRQPWRREIIPLAVVGDICFIVILGIGLIVPLEWLIRRREARKTMSEPDKPKRKFWQFHLSTTVLMMLTASILSWCSFTGELQIRGPHGEAYAYGWPVHLLRNDFIDEGEIEFTTDEWSQFQSIWSVVAIDTAVAIAIVSAVTVASEWLIRCRESRKP